MAEEIAADYASMRAAADAIERIPDDCGVTRLSLDYDGDYGHDGVQSEAEAFLVRWRAGGREMERAHTGIATDVRETAAAMEFVDGLVDGTFGFFSDLLGGED